MKAFIRTILAYDPNQENEDGGVLGMVSAYYGTVEAQGRGSLHCHMMIWLAGGLNPNEIKEKALGNGGDLDFQKRLIEFLNDTISTEVPPDPNPQLETPLSKCHPCATRGAGPNIDPELIRDAEAHDLHNLVERCQRHRHTHTCYKYWKGYPESKDYRFDLDESNVTPITMFDPDTGEITMRCLDGLVNNFNITMMKAIRCNMDIKFIGSGPTAKAILYYITDYITKSQLQAHVAYAALEVAVQRLGEFDPEEDDLTARARRLLQKCAHSLISKQELSAQQVVSYLMDFEDHFTSHQYVHLFWTSFEGFIQAENPSPECYPVESAGTPDIPSVDSEAVIDDDADSVVGDLEEEADVPLLDDELVQGPDDELTVSLDQEGKLRPTANQVCDYQHRGRLLESV
ncbi:hypothetical protein FB451DRAFT_969998, partial [Mycena latifolia]